MNIYETDSWQVMPPDFQEKTNFEQFQEYVSDVLKGERRFSFSALKSFRNAGPYGFLLNRTQAYKETPAMVIGRLVEDLLFDLENVQKKYAVWNGPARNTKAGKELWAKFQQDAENKTIIKQSDFDIAKYYAKRVLSNPEARHIIFNTEQTQKQLLYDVAGIKFVGYSDMEGTRGSKSFVADLKLVTNKSTVRQLEWEMRDRWFDAQAACYTIDRSDVKFFFIVLMQGGNCEVFECTRQTRELAMLSVVDYTKQFKNIAHASKIEPAIWFRGSEVLRNHQEKILMF